MNIEQIKKDWEKHCEEHGAEFVIDDSCEDIISLHVLVNSNYHKSRVIERWSDSRICIHKDIELYIDYDYENCVKSLFTSFYKKLMEESNE